MQKRDLYLGIFFGIFANVIWALGVLIPKMLSDFSSMEITMGRYLSYGLFSLFIFFFIERKTLRSYGAKLWLRAFFYAFAGNIIYFIGCVIGIKLSGAALTALIIGTLPITVAFYGNLMRKEYPFARLVMPSLLILVGLIIMNIQSLLNVSPASSQNFLLGIAGSVTAIVFWTWYAVSNADFLKNRPDITTQSWSTFIGISCLLWMVLALPISIYTHSIDITKFTSAGHDLILYAIGSLILGIFVSWLATIMWNKASVLLPVALSGQLIIFSTVFTLIFVYIYDRQLPTLAETLGSLLTLVGVLAGVRATTTTQRVAASASAVVLDAK